MIRSQSAQRPKAPPSFGHVAHRQSSMLQDCRTQDSSRGTARSRKE
jgi:hypothetical protein